MFLHGYLASGNTFYHQLKYFSREFDVFAPDLKGFGENLEMPYPYSLDDYVKEVKEYCYKNGLNSPYVVAHSFGARIVLKGVYTKELSFDKIVITGGAGLTPKVTLKKRLKKTAFSVLKKFIKKEKLKSFYSSDYNSLSPIMKQSFIKIVNERLDYTLPYIKTKTLLIFGEKDKETPLYMAKKFEKGLQNSTLITFKDAGHFCFLDKPQTFNTEVKEFFLS